MLIFSIQMYNKEKLYINNVFIIDGLTIPSHGFSLLTPLQTLILYRDASNYIACHWRNSAAFLGLNAGLTMENSSSCLTHLVV